MPTILVSLGNPYLISGLPEVGSYLIGWRSNPVTEEAVARALAGAAPITGTPADLHSPRSIAAAGAWSEESRRPPDPISYPGRAMTLALSDWLIIAALLRRLRRDRPGLHPAGQPIAGGLLRLAAGSLPWWLAGTSMVATTFAADTPLAVAGLVAKYGVAGNWLWWNGAISGILTVFFFARLWRRAGVLTDVEFAELRYGGRPAAVLRGFRALYLALPINLIIMGWVTRAMVTILADHARRRSVDARRSSCSASPRSTASSPGCGASS